MRTLGGWRRELVGEELLAMLRGERSLAVSPTGHLAISTQKPSVVTQR